MLQSFGDASSVTSDTSLNVNLPEFNTTFTGLDDHSDDSSDSDEFLHSLETIATGSNSTNANIVIQTSDASNSSAFQASNNVIEWHIDSGASSHMSGSKALFKKSSPHSGTVQIADGKILNITKIADLKLNVGSGNVTVKNVAHVDGLNTNLLSVYKMVELGNTVIFDKKGCRILNSNQSLVASCKPVNGVYTLAAQKEQSFFAGKNSADALTWHQRLGHVNEQTLRKMMKSVAGLNINKMNFGDVNSCVACSEGKQAADPHPPSNTRAENILDLVHTDLCGPFTPQSLGGSK